MACLEENQMSTDEIAVAAGGDPAADHRNDPLDSGDMDLSGEDHVPKPRKPYTITKQREKWTEDEHKRFLEALQLHGRAWRRIQEHIGTKTAVQIRSHAQKFFTKVVRESSGSNTAEGAAAPAIQIPPPRPKRKPAHPYPRKVEYGAAKKHAPLLRHLEKPGPQSLRDRDDDGSPTSVLTAAREVSRAEALGSVFASSSSGSMSPGTSATGSDEHANSGGGSPASSVDREDGGVSPGVATAGLAARTADTKVFGDAKGGTDAPTFKLFGKKVSVKDSYEHLHDAGDLKTDASAAQATRSTTQCGAPEGSSWNPWPSSVQVQQLMYFVPQPDGFAARSAGVPWLAYNGSLPCALFYPQAAAPPAQHHQPSEPLDHKHMQREGSLTGSNTGSSAAVPAASAAAQNSDAAESHGPGRETTSGGDAAPADAVRRLTKCPSSASFSRRGFVPYKRCAAESEAPRAVAAGEEADGELTRLCL
ncbi:unnamed protein product [Urochloa decumbens]|uniref:LHY n=1 Tax=Urochloa decumbens TaxID=240449 RepID=A0ABC8V7M3_9POAL